MFIEIMCNLLAGALVRRYICFWSPQKTVVFRALLLDYVLRLSLLSCFRAPLILRYHNNP